MLGHPVKVNVRRAKKCETCNLGYQFQISIQFSHSEMRHFCSPQN